MRRIHFVTALLALAVLTLVGCSPRYVIVDKLQKPLAGAATCKVGTIVDGLPPEVDASDRPTEFHIQKFEGAILQALADEKVFERSALAADTGVYEVSGTILEYEKGSGFVRFLIGFGAGNSKVTTNLKLTETRTGVVVFSGNFIGSVGDWTVKGDKMYEYVAKNFAKALKKENKKLLEAGKQ